MTNDRPKRLDDVLRRLERARASGTTVPVYVAAPYGSETLGGIGRNCDRATLIGRWLADLGAAPIVPHVLGPRLFGEEDTDDPGACEVRAAALRYGEALAATVAHARGVFLALARPDGTLSQGCAKERDVYLRILAAPWVVVVSWGDLLREWSADPDRYADGIFLSPAADEDVLAGAGDDYERVFP